MAHHQDEPLVGRRGAYVGGALAAVALAVLTTLVVRRWAPLMELDASVATWVHEWALDNAWAVTVSRWLRVVGGGVVATAVAVGAVLVLWFAGRRWQAFALAVVAALAPFLTDRLKDLVERPRPVWAVPFSDEPTWAFPSGHATAGIAVYAACGVALAALLPSPTAGAWFALPWILLGVAIGVSRTVLGVHWPSDVVGGWLVALTVAGFASALIVLGPHSRGPG